MNDNDLDQLLADAAGIRDDDLRSPAVRAAMRVATAEVVAMSRPRAADGPDPDHFSSRISSTGRRGRAVLAAAAAIAVLAVAVTVTTDGSGRSGDAPDVVALTTGPPDGVAGSDSATVGGPVELEAQVVSATREAAAGSVVQITQVNVDGYRDTMWSDEVSGAFRIRTMAEDGTTVLYDSGPPSVDELGVHRSVDHCLAEYTEVTERMGPSGDPDDTVPVTPAPAESIVERLALWLEAGDVVEDGTEVVDGEEMLRFRWVDEERVMYVDPETHRPATIHGYPGTEHEYVQTYEFLDRTPANLDLLGTTVPDGFTLVEELGSDAERADAGCI